jgi:outer membrane protein assembly factor BamD (BamD/ComL family)
MMTMKMRILDYYKKNGHYIAEAKRSTITVAAYVGSCSSYLSVCRFYFY